MRALTLLIPVNFEQLNESPQLTPPANRSMPNEHNQNFLSDDEPKQIKNSYLIQ